MMKRNDLENRDNSETREFFIETVMYKLILKSIGSMILLLLIIPQALYSQAPAIEWVNLYGEHAQARGIQVTPDSGYIACGFIGTVDDEDYYLVRVNPDGDTIWTRRYDFFNAGNEALYSVDLASDGGYVTTGYGDWNGTSLKCFILKVNSVGDTVWSRTYNVKQGTSIFHTSDDGYIITGGGFGVGYMLLKINSEGDEMWTGIYGNGWSWDVHQTTDGGYICTGDDGAGPTTHLIKAVRTNADGDSIWSKTFYGGRGNSVRQTDDGGFIISGYTRDFGPCLRPCLIKTNADGDTLWTKVYTTPESYCTGSYVRQTTDGGYILAESGSVDILRKTDSEGNTVWILSLPGFGYTHIHSLQITPENGYIVAGYDWPSGSSWKLYLAKTEPDPTIVDIDDNNSSIPIHYSLLQNYPNPFKPSGAGHSPETTISFNFSRKDAKDEKIEIYNIKGQKIKTLPIPQSEISNPNSVVWDGTDNNNKPVTSGIYFYKFKTDNFEKTRKMILMK